MIWGSHYFWKGPYVNHSNYTSIFNQPTNQPEIQVARGKASCGRLPRRAANPQMDGTEPLEWYGPLRPGKINTTGSKIPMFNRKYIFIPGGISIVMLVFFGGGASWLNKCSRCIAAVTYLLPVGQIPANHLRYPQRVQTFLKTGTLFIAARGTNLWIALTPNLCAFFHHPCHNRPMSVPLIIVAEVFKDWC